MAAPPRRLGARMPAHPPPWISSPHHPRHAVPFPRVPPRSARDCCAPMVPQPPRGPLGVVRVRPFASLCAGAAMPQRAGVPPSPAPAKRSRPGAVPPPFGDFSPSVLCSVSKGEEEKKKGIRAVRPSVLRVVELPAVGPSALPALLGRAYVSTGLVPRAPRGPARSSCVPPVGCLGRSCAWVIGLAGPPRARLPGLLGSFVANGLISFLRYFLIYY